MNDHNVVDVHVERVKRARLASRREEKLNIEDLQSVAAFITVKMRSVTVNIDSTVKLFQPLDKITLGDGTVLDT